jgi:hypothetical protein
MICAMATEKLPKNIHEEPISKEEFDKKDEALTEALDRLEKEALPPKPRPEPIGGMF